jgi:hypothetical protein
VYRYGADGAPTFIEAAASTGEELHALLQTVIARFMKMITRRGVLVEEIGQTWLAEPDTNGEEARTVRPLLGEADVRHAKPVLPRSVLSCEKLVGETTTSSELMRFCNRLGAEDGQWQPTGDSSKVRQSNLELRP